MTTNLRVCRHARNWQIVSFMKNLFLEDELKYFFVQILLGCMPIYFG